MARSKVKSRSYHDFANLEPPANAPTEYQLPKPYGFQDIAQKRFKRSRSLRQDHRSIQGHTMTFAYLHPLTNVLTKYQLPTPYHSRDVTWTRFYRSWSLRKGQTRSYHDNAHLQPLTNVPTKYQLPTPYGCQDITRTRFSNSRSLQQGQRSNQDHIMTLHTYTP